jgi:DNA repair protein RadA/Sms
MSKVKTLYNCSKCDAQFQKWIGRCLECGSWGTIEQEIVHKTSEQKIEDVVSIKTQKLADVSESSVKRVTTNIGELDRVLGGGIVPGSLLLLGGEPGIGKSTLSLQLANIVSNTIYISGEESTGQIKLRATRLGVKNPELQLGNETNIEAICGTIKKEKPTLAIVDSIQTMYSTDANGEPGNVSQIRACTTKLLEAAKSTNTAVCIIGHVTKDGNVAGPKTLEHLVDTVLYLEGDRYYETRLLRTIKNRFGSTDEVGVFNMKQHGLEEVLNPSAIFLEEKIDNTSGSVVTCLMEGTRPMLIEIQALVNKTSFGYPVRKASGFDLNRLHVLVAVLEKRAGLQLGQYDIHVNVVGGMKADEPAADLAVCLAIASSYKDKNLSGRIVAFGEVGLGGEVRRVNQVEKRIKECQKLGIKKIVTKTKSTTSSVLSVNNIQELINKT